mmetsp:Transcript_20080/g.36302  ORF Transcript_20080/g.36302 Transcript_20080/m.36302 type:complete len:384 (+) Transcript_20080:147-1298(+)
MVALEEDIQLCIIEGASQVNPRNERALVLFALAVHVADIGTDLAVAICFLILDKVFLFAVCSILIAGTCTASAIWVKRPQEGFEEVIDLDNAYGNQNRYLELAWRVAKEVPPLQVAAEAYLCIHDYTGTQRFYQLRMAQVVAEALPNALLQSLVLAMWSNEPQPPNPLCAGLIQLSVLTSIVSISSGLASWEHQAQVVAPWKYIMCTALVRVLEVASRCSMLAFLALAAGLTTAWLLLLDYCCLVLLLLQHRHFEPRQGLLMAVPLVLVSIEPFVWQSCDHTVPKDMYYALRMLEATLFWTIAIFADVGEPGAKHCQGQVLSSWFCNGLVPLITSVLFFGALPSMSRWAERMEVSQNVEQPSRQCLNGSFQVETMEEPDECLE